MIDRRLAGTRRARRALAALAGRPLNFDPSELEAAGEPTGWRVDDYAQMLPSEPPGEPLPGASFAAAQRLLRDYAFADPAMVRAVYDPDVGLLDRNMLLQVRFGPLRLLVGCRVRVLTDELTTIDGRDARVWGWGYGTLAGHFERGQMDFAICKWLDDGAVAFRIHVVSRHAERVNPIVRLGIGLVGRRRQVRFAQRCCARMRALVERELAP